MDWEFNAHVIAPAQPSEAVSPWAQHFQAASQAPAIPEYANDSAAKQRFAIELANGASAFNAGLEAFDGDTAKGLWASFNWPKDIEVIAIKDAYVAAQRSVEKPLDKEQLLAKIMGFFDETDDYGRHVVEAKERLNALRLYSDIRGFTGKVDINASTTTNQFGPKTVNLVMVRPDQDKSEPKVIEGSTNIKSEIKNDPAPGIKLKLVGAG